MRVVVTTRSHENTKGGKEGNRTVLKAKENTTGEMLWNSDEEENEAARY